MLEMSCRIDTDGRVIDMLVEPAPAVGAHAFITAAEDALRDWRYDPADPALDSEAACGSASSSASAKRIRSSAG